MRSSKAPGLTLIALLVLCFGLAARLDSWFQDWQGSRAQSGDVMSVLLGDGRRMFSNHFFVKADEYYHSGYYPTIFDNREAFQTQHMAEDAGAVEGKNQGDEAGFLGKPRDWIEAFGRHFIPYSHTHLDEGGATGDLSGSAEVREILPWLRLSSELDPNRVETYTVAAYWLRERMHKVAEAEQFLREGLHANPNSYEILFELGRVYSENKNDPGRARNLWLAALRNYNRQELPKEKPDHFPLIQIVSHLAVLEEKQGNYRQALDYMEKWKAASPQPEEIQKLIEGVRQKMSSATPGPTDHPAGGSGKVS